VSEEIDPIERKEAELMPYRSRMEELKIAFINEIIRFTADWYRKTMKEYVMKYPEATLSMSAEKIGFMKYKINELVKNTEKIVRSELDNPDLWWHQKPDSHAAVDQYKQIGDRYPAILDRAMRHVLGYLGVILEEWRFHVNASGNTGTYQEFWFEHPLGSLQSVPYYPHLLRWTEEMQDIIREYDDQFSNAIILSSEIEQLKGEKKKKEALSLWDSV
jgi:hypothetical protein